MGTGSDGRLELCRRVWVLAWFWQSQAGSVTLAPLAWVQGTGSLSNECRASLQDTLGPFLGVSVALLSN